MNPATITLSDGTAVIINVAQTAELHSVPRDTAAKRIKTGWDVLRACTEKPRPYYREWQPIHSTKEE